jgi:alkylhydroperoxidase family enzyme
MSAAAPGGPVSGPATPAHTGPAAALDPWVPLLSPEATKGAAARAGVPDILAGLNVFRMLLHRERLAKGAADLLLSLLLGTDLDQRLRELVVMRIAWTTSSLYEWTQHWGIALDVGVDPADLLGVRDWPSHTGFSSLERAALAAVDECRAGGAVTPSTMGELREQLDDGALVELVAAIGTWSMMSVLLRSLAVPLEDGMDPWPPDGSRP